MNYPLLTVHWISMYLAIAGGVMLAVWVYKNLKKDKLLAVIFFAIILGLIGSYLTFDEEVKFMTSIFK